MKMKHILIASLVAITITACKKEAETPGLENRMSEKSTPTPAPVITSKPKAAGTVSAAEDVPMSRANADASQTPHK